MLLPLRQWVWSSTLPASHKSMQEVRTDLLVPGPSPCALHASCCPSHLAVPAFAATPGTPQCVCAWCIGHLPLQGHWVPDLARLTPSAGRVSRGDSVLFPASLHPAALPGGGSISKPQRAGGSSARAGLVQRWRGAQPCAHPGSCQLSGEPRLGWFFLLLGMTSLHSLQRAGREGGRACA